MVFTYQKTFENVFKQSTSMSKELRNEDKSQRVGDIEYTCSFPNQTFNGVL